MPLRSGIGGAESTKLLRKEGWGAEALLWPQDQKGGRQCPFDQESEGRSRQEPIERMGAGERRSHDKNRSNAWVRERGGGITSTDRTHGCGREGKSYQEPIERMGAGERRSRDKNRTNAWVRERGAYRTHGCGVEGESVERMGARESEREPIERTGREKGGGTNRPHGREKGEGTDRPHGAGERGRNRSTARAGERGWMAMTSFGH